MTSANSKNKDDQPTRQERSRAAIEGYSIAFEERSRLGQILVRKGRHLDVDGVLARSLPIPGAFSVPDIKTMASR
jgi:hypothetical protein